MITEIEVDKKLTQIKDINSEENIVNSGRIQGINIYRENINILIAKKNFFPPKRCEILILNEIFFYSLKKIIKNKKIDCVNFKHDKINASERDKRVATANDEPYIKVLQVDFESAQPNVGSFELDWNASFIDILSEAGYTGSADEAIIDAWFNDVCRNILMEDFNDQNFVADAPLEVKRKDGKTEKH